MALIQVFAKPPVKGQVKTRLIPDLGESVATTIYRYCLDYTLNMVRQSELNYQVWLSEDSNDPIFQGEAYCLQQGDNLGSRMYHAINSQLEQQAPGDSKIILIGTDCLDMTIKHLNQAIQTLCSHDIVLSPAFDGGFALIACRKIDSRIFTNVEWGSNSAFAQTLDNAQAMDYQVAILETIRDIDTLQDVNRYTELMSLI